MAYADARHTQRNVSTVALVAVFEAGLGLALIAGLSISFTRDPPRPPVTTFNVPPQIDEPIDPPSTRPDTPRLVTQPPIVNAPVIVGTAPQISSRFDEGAGGGEGLGAVAFPTPTPSPVPSFSPVRARPRGNPANWVTDNDYPTSAIRAEEQGRTAFRLSLDASGKVTDCAITASSGSPALDAATCAKLTRRARFEPAIDSTGARIAGFYLGSVNWRLPEE